MRVRDVFFLSVVENKARLEMQRHTEAFKGDGKTVALLILVLGFPLRLGNTGGMFIFERIINVLYCCAFLSIFCSFFYFVGSATRLQ